MVYYTEFQDLRTTRFNTNTMRSEKVAPHLVDGCGSDSVFILDGRNNLPTMIEDSLKQMERLKNVQDYRGFKIYKGSRFSDDNPCIYESSILNSRKTEVTK